MPRKGMRSIFYSSSSKTSSSSSSPSLTRPSTPSRSFSPSISRPMTPHHRSSSPLSRPSTPLHSFSESMMDENVDVAEAIIIRWDTESSSYAKVTSLFYENRIEAREFLRSVKNLQKAMQFYVSENLSSQKLVRAQNLMQLAMKRLEKEFYQILSANRDHLDQESVSGPSSRASERSSVSDYDDDIGSEDEIRNARDSIGEVERVSSAAMSDLRAIAECMISSGYGKECVKIYEIIRKSIIDEGIYRLGFQKMSSSRIQKLDWEVLELKIKHWLHAVKITVKNLFAGERILCDHVFSASHSIKESCFSEICKEAAVNLFAFPEFVSKCKKSPEKMFRMLDLYDAIADIWPEVESTFSYESTSAVRSQTLTSLLKLGEAVRTMLFDFESAIQKDHSKSPVSGAGIHPLTRYVMNYISFLSDYSLILSDIFADWPLQVQTPLSETFDCFSFDDNPTSPISVRLAWLILVLLCKLDGKADLYKDVALSYLFLANNLDYVVSKVQSSNLRYLLGDEWTTKHETKVTQYAANYEKMAWNKVLSLLPNNPTVEISPSSAKEWFRKFNSAFEEAYRKQSSWVVPDSKLRDDIKMSIANKIVPAYRQIYEKCRVLLREENNIEVVVRFAPEDLVNHLSDMFYGSGVSGSVSSSSKHSWGSR